MNNNRRSGVPSRKNEKDFSFYNDYEDIEYTGHKNRRNAQDRPTDIGLLFNSTNDLLSIKPRTQDKELFLINKTIFYDNLNKIINIYIKTNLNSKLDIDISILNGMLKYDDHINYLYTYDMKIFNDLVTLFSEKYPDTINLINNNITKLQKTLKTTGTNSGLNKFVNALM